MLTTIKLCGHLEFPFLYLDSFINNPNYTKLLWIKGYDLLSTKSVDWIIWSGESNLYTEFEETKKNFGRIFIEEFGGERSNLR